MDGKGKNYYEGKTVTDYFEGLDKVSEEIPYADWFKLVQDIPNLSTANVLDAGCGYGRYTEPFRTMTTGQIYGVDISEDMLTLASRRESNKENMHLQPVRYERADITGDICKSLELEVGFFDVVNACWVIQHSHSEAVLIDMLTSLCNCLKKGGVLIGITLHPEMTQEFIKNTQGHGISFKRKDLDAPLTDGELLVTTFSDENGNVIWDTQDYYYRKETYLRVFREAGFERIELLPIQKPEVRSSNRYMTESDEDEEAILFRAVK